MPDLSELEEPFGIDEKVRLEMVWYRKEWTELPEHLSRLSEKHLLPSTAQELNLLERDVGG